MNQFLTEVHLHTKESSSCSKVSAQEMIDLYYQQNGYILVQAHPFRNNIQLAPLEYIDGIEVYNGCHNEHSRNKKAFQYGKNTNKILTSGSDFHHPKDLARGGIITQKEIKNIQQFVQILKSGEYTIKTT